MTMTWEHGRQLSTLTKDGGSISYTYNADGIRTSKTVNGQTTEYILDGSTILGEKLPDGEYLYYLYDENGVRYGFARGSLLYYYVCNAQGDVVKILTSGGATAAWYEYDAWGNVVCIGGNAYVANLNPIRYRGYYYDTETGFYYLNSRYYDPEICRFVNADDSNILWEDQGHLNEHNLYAYCLNSPICNKDDSGSIAEDIMLGAGLAVGTFGLLIGIIDVINALSMHSGSYSLSMLGPQDILWTPSQSQQMRHYEFETRVVGKDVKLYGPAPKVLKQPDVMDSVNVKDAYDILIFYKSHSKNARPSTEEKHQKGDTRRGMDSGKEKGDKRRINYRKAKTKMFQR